MIDHRSKIKADSDTHLTDVSEVVFLNHSSLLVKSNQTKVLCDPWFEGSAFNNGWRLLFENSHNINDIESDYIWISHEHPDHFSIPTLSKLTTKRVFLYQKTADKKVFNYLTTKHHLVTEIDDAQSVSWGDLKVTTFISDGYDSAALFEFKNGKSFLNLNDARVELGETLEKIRKAAPSSIDLIAMQFSYANWAGNEGDSQISLDQQERVLERIIKVCEVLKPKKVLLFASYVYYSHEENFYWNKKFWLPDVVNTLTQHGIEVIVPTPNQRIDLNKLFQFEYHSLNVAGLSFWQEKAQEQVVRDVTDKSKALSDITQGYEDFFLKLWSENTLKTIKTPNNSNFKIRVQMSDLKCVIDIYLFEKKVELVESGQDDWDCQLTAETLLFLFKNKFGRGTITINSRVQFNYSTAHRFFIFFFIPYANNIGRFFNEQNLTVEQLGCIANTSVMMSIFKFHQAAKKNFENDLLLFQ